MHIPVVLFFVLIPVCPAIAYCNGNVSDGRGNVRRGDGMPDANDNPDGSFVRRSSYGLVRPYKRYIQCMV